MTERLAEARVQQIVGAGLVVFWCAEIAIGMTVGAWFLVPIGVGGLAFGAAIVVVNAYIEAKETTHGLDRRTNPQVHGDPGGAADNGPVFYSSSGGTYVTSFAYYPGPEPRTVERTGIRLGEVEGYRAWVLRGPLLLSFNGAVWLPGEPMKGIGLDENNGLGVHAFKSLQDAADYAKHTGPAVVGKVKLWGEIVEHTDGYRGEFAKPSSIIGVAGVFDGSFEDINLTNRVMRTVLQLVADTYDASVGEAA